MSTMTPIARDSLFGNALAIKATYTRMNNDILAVVRAIPVGRITTVDAISQYLNVPTRHVHYLLARRDDLERESSPWHRVLAHRGAIGRGLYDARGRSQVELLAAEGVEVGYRGKVTGFAARYFQPSLETTGVIPSR
ncbi:MGMT family protein [Gemmatimonas sp.]|jgi:alkylated DNA nucleotide flippase Atl1|uniref:MGMT family protein n=1 Tax=Gemmatimonas sp. TaxID=1962908 RepID=UPI0037C14390